MQVIEKFGCIVVTMQRLPNTGKTKEPVEQASKTKKTCVIGSLGETGEYRRRRNAEDNMPGYIGIEKHPDTCVVATGENANLYLTVNFSNRCLHLIHKGSLCN